MTALGDRSIFIRSITMQNVRIMPNLTTYFEILTEVKVAMIYAKMTAEELNILKTYLKTFLAKTTPPMPSVAYEIMRSMILNVIILNPYTDEIQIKTDHHGKSLKQSHPNDRRVARHICSRMMLAKQSATTRREIMGTTTDASQFTQTI